MSNFNTATLEQHKQMIVDAINDGIINDDNIENLHNEVFNTDYFIIGYYQADQWIQSNFDSIFDAINIVREYEIANFGEFTAEITSEKIANMLSYICGEEVISELGDLDDLNDWCHGLDMFDNLDQAQTLIKKNELNIDDIEETVEACEEYAVKEDVINTLVTRYCFGDDSSLLYNDASKTVSEG